MTSTFHSKLPPTEVIHAPGLIDKTTEHPLGMLLLGEVVAVQYLPARVLFYYADGRVTRLTLDGNDNFSFSDHVVPSC